MKKLSVLFTLIMVVAVMACMMIPSFADETVADTADVSETVEETTADTTAADTTVADTTVAADVEAEEEDHAGHDHNGNGIPDDQETTNGWEEIGVGEIIAIAVAVVLAVGAITTIIIIAPKKSKQK